MENKDYYEEYKNWAQTPTPRREYTPAQRYLILIALLIGLLCDRLLFTGWAENYYTINEFGIRYGIFWGAYLIAFYLLTWQRSKRRYDAWFLCAIAVLIFARYYVYHDESLNMMNLFILPLLLMLHMVFASADPEQLRDGRIIPLYLRGWFVAPFCRIGAFFGAVSSMSSKDGNKKNSKAVLIGLLIGIPLLIIILALLAEADTVIGYYTSHFFEDINLGELIGHMCAIIIVMLLFYSFLWNASYETPSFNPAPQGRKLPAVSAYIVLSMLLVVYAAFTYVQFAYLTGLRGLPAELTYSEYAVSGFKQLILVAGINFCLFGLALKFAEQEKAMKPLLGALLVSTCVILYSGIKRLAMYIEAYGLTFARILPMWFMILLCFVLLICIIRLFVPRFRTFRRLILGTVIWYFALNCLNIDAVIAQSAVQRAIEHGGMNADDIQYTAGLSQDADGIRNQYGKQFGMYMPVTVVNDTDKPYYFEIKTNESTDEEFIPAHSTRRMMIDQYGDTTLSLALLDEEWNTVYAQTPAGMLRETDTITIKASTSGNPYVTK